MMSPVLQAVQAGHPTNTLYGRLVRHVHERPQALAIRAPDGDMSWSTLFDQSQSAATALTAMGVTKGDVVIVNLPPERAFFALLLAIVRIGATYIPLDIKMSGIQVAQCIELARPTLFIGPDGDTRADVRESCSLVDAQHVTAAGLSSSPLSMSMPEPSEDLATAAYGILTSGSTGVPKIVLIPGAAILNLLDGLDSIQPLDSQDRSSLWSDLNFDASIQEIFCSLSAGAPVIVAPTEVRRDPQEFALWLRAERITCAFVPPFYLEELADAIETHPAFALRRIAVGVETVRHGPCLRIVRALPGCTIINGYGPAEATVCPIVYPLRVDTGAAPDTAVPVGKPLPGMSLHLLNEHKQPVTHGEVGEIYLGGVGVAIGYLNAPQETARRFVRLEKHANETLYQTGDLGRLDSNGDLHFVGRKDFQLKINGVRIDPQYLEAMICQHPGIRHCFVDGIDGPFGRQVLAALIEHDADGTGAENMRSALAALLPPYLMPSYLHRVDEIAKSANGKLDRRRAASALSALCMSVPASALAPLDGDDALLAEVMLAWREIAPLYESADLDAFTAGIDSLSAARIAGAVRRRLALACAPTDVLANRTPRNLAGTLARRSEDGQPVKHAVHQAAPAETVGAPAPLVPNVIAAMFLHATLHPHSVSYQAQSILTIRGPLDLPALRTSLGKLVARHTILHTRFELNSTGQVVPHPVPVWEPDLDVVRLAGTDGDLQDRLAAMIDSEVQELIPPSAFPLIKWRLYRLSEQHHVLLQVEQHIVHDGRSSRLLLRDMLAEYARQVGSQLPPAPAIAASFSDFAAWENQHSRTIGARAFWKDYLHQAPQDFRLAAASKSASASLTGKQLRVEMGSARWLRFEQACLDRGATPFRVAFSLYAMTLKIFADQDEFLLGTSVANRPASCFDDTVGMFVNLIPVRIGHFGDMAPQAVISAITGSLDAALEHSELPMSDIVHATEIGGRHFGAAPLQVLFSMHDSLQHKLHRVGGLDLELKELLSNGSTKFELSATLIPSTALHANHGAELVIDYDPSIYGHWLVEEIANSFQDHLDRFVRNFEEAGARAESMPQLPEAASVPAQPAGSISLARRLRDTAAANADRIAVVDGHANVSYRELWQRVDKYRSQLLADGLQRNDMVAIRLTPGADLVVAILAVLASGAAYIPIDVTNPPDRVRLALQTAAVPYLIAEQGKEAVHWEGLEVLAAPGDNHDPAHSAGEPVEAADDEIAYGIFTSGSTGEAKLAMNRYRGLLGLLDWYCAELAIDVGSTVLLAASPGFDLAQKNILAPLTRGATLVVPDSLENLTDELTKGTLPTPTVINCAPTVFAVLLQLLAQPRYHSQLKHVVLGGEPIPDALVKDWYGRSGCRIVNSYGPAECADVVAFHVIPNAELTSSDGSIIGRAITGCVLELRDSAGVKVPRGAIGELWIGGGAVGAGYLGRPDLTRERFVECIEGGVRKHWYRTGDLCLQTAEGELKFVGRRDQQVKINGARLELGEIEAVASNFLGGARCAAVAVTVTGMAAGVVLFVERAPQQASPSELLAALNERLPSYMVPRTIMQADVLPFNRNGKLDRQELLVQATRELRQQASVQVGFPEAANEQGQLERDFVCNAVSALLGIQPADDANLFQHGMNSLQLIRLISQCRQHFSVPLRLADCARRPSIRRLAELIALQVNQQAASCSAADSDLSTLATGTHVT